MKTWVGKTSRRTVHQLLFFQCYGESWAITLQVKSNDMESCAAIMTFDSERASLVLHGEVIANGARAIADEVVSLGEAFSYQEVVEQVIKRFLPHI